jgi:hypothetical protein
MTFESQRYALASIRDQLRAQARRLENQAKRNGNREQKIFLHRLSEKVAAVVSSLDEIKSVKGVPESD